MKRAGKIPARRADQRDGEVGHRIRARRLERRLSQTELADRIGVTFQQVQKYEKGTNRLGASRLSRVAEALDVPVSFFFQEGASTPRESHFHLLQNAATMRLVTALDKIKDARTRQMLIDMAERLARD